MVSVCYACGRAVPDFSPCQKCRKKYCPKHVWVRSEYSGSAKKLVQACKFDQNREAADIMAGMMAENLPYYDSPPLVTFVPTANIRKRERGFDQAELIARQIAKLKKYPFSRLLIRRTGLRQLGAKREIRKKQLKGAFRPVNQYLSLDRNILLIDDVLTTGATIEACTKELYKAGAARVDATVFARTPNI